MENKFKVGDKVIFQNKYKGTIVADKEDSMSGNSYGVKFDEKRSCWHNLSGRVDDDLGWWCTEKELQKTSFSRDELQFADILTLRNGERYVVADNHMRGEARRYRHEDDTITTWYNDDLTQNEDNKDEDIVKVERAGQVVYERQEAVEMTIAEISEKLGYEIKVVKEK